ncbi:tetratricopeptide repeat protein, partial [bacterium]|nr:tetratricopeptide repeat protein [bacterium]
ELLSRSFLLLREDDKAIKFYEKLLADNPKHIAALSSLGNMYFTEAIKDDNKELLKKSVNYNERLLEERPNDPRAMKDLALSYYHMGNTEKAMEIFEDAVANNESDLILRVNYGKILYETGEKEKAEEVFKKGLDMDPDNIVALKTLARFYTIDIKDYEKGRNILAKLVEVEPENGNMWEMLGICEANLGNKEEAEKAFKKAEDLRTVNP